MKINLQSSAFVFPGQGSQAVGMGKDLAAAYSVAKETFDEADAILGFSLSELMWSGSARPAPEGAAPSLAAGHTPA